MNRADEVYAHMYTSVIVGFGIFGFDTITFRKSDSGKTTSFTKVSMKLVSSELFFFTPWRKEYMF